MGGESERMIFLNLPKYTPHKSKLSLNKGRLPHRSFHRRRSFGLARPFDQQMGQSLFYAKTACNARKNRANTASCKK